MLKSLVEELESTQHIKGKLQQRDENYRNNKMIKMKKQMKNTINKLISRLNTVLKRISGIEDRLIKIIQSETDGKEREKRTKHPRAGGQSQTV